MTDTRQQLEQFISEFVSESDRAAVIVGAAQIDELLAEIIANHLLPCTKANDNFIYGSGPLSTFSARIDYCYRAGIVTKEFKKALDLIRKLRNSFAHQTQGCSLTEGPQHQRVKELVQPYADRLFFNQVIVNGFGGIHSPENEFRAVLAIHMHRLYTIKENINRIKPNTWAPLIPNWELLREEGFI